VIRRLGDRLAELPERSEVRAPEQLGELNPAAADVLVALHAGSDVKDELFQLRLVCGLLNHGTGLLRGDHTE